MQTNLSLTRQCVIDIEQLIIQPCDLKRAGQHILDWVACASLGKVSPAGEIYNSLIDFNTNSDETQSINTVADKCTAIGGRKCHWQDALSHNGALGNVLEMDDIHRSSILHPGPVVIPAALAIAEHVNASIEEFLTAVIKGYEVTIWLGQIIGQSHYKYFHNTATCGSLGSAMAVSSLLKLDEQQTVWALGNAGSKTGGLWQMRNEKVLTKQWHNSESARSGTMAAVLASQGLSGPEFILEGPQGIFNAMSTDAVFDHQSALTKKNTDNAERPKWRMYDCSFKPWPACRHAHPAIDALLSIMQQHNLTSGTEMLNRVLSIEVEVYKDAMVFCDRPVPETELQAKFSIQHALAAIIKWGTPALAHYLKAAFTDADIIKLRKKINISCNQSIQEKYPQHFGVKCTLILEGSDPLSLALQDTLGDPERALTRAQLHDKAKMLLAKAGMKSSNILSLCEFDWTQNANISSLTQLFNFEAHTNEV